MKVVMSRKTSLPIAIAFSLLLLLFGAGPSAAQRGDSCEEGLRDANAKCYRGNCGEALPLYDSLVEKNASCPENLKSEVYYGRGRAKETAQDYRGAVADYGTALKMNPESAIYREALGRGHYLLGNQEERLGNFKGAYEDYGKALQHTPDSREAAEGLASIFYQRGMEKQKQGNLRGAMEDFSQALKLRPNFPDAMEAKRNLTERMRHKAAERDAMFTF
jgi:tetratricopeptide (TPR) repeat protein